METLVEKALIQLAPMAMESLEYASQHFDAKIAQGVTPPDLLVPGFWAHHAIKLKPFDEIRVHAEDGTWMAYYVVLDCSRTWAKVHCLSTHHLTTGDVAMSQASEAEVKSFINQHQIVHRGPRGWSVVRKGDKAILVEDLQKDQAAIWLEAHARTMIGAPPAPKPEAVAA